MAIHQLEAERIYDGQYKPLTNITGCPQMMGNVWWPHQVVDPSHWHPARAGVHTATSSKIIMQ